MAGYKELIFIRTLSIVAVLILSIQISAPAQAGPQPPCGRNPVPDYPPAEDAAVVKLWSRAELGRSWNPPVCTGWSGTGFTTLVSTSARFQHTTELEGLLRRVAAVSGYAGIRYWSSTHKDWRTFIMEAHAVKGPPPERPRGDFTADEMKAGSILYFEQADNLAGKAIYRLHIAETAPNRLVFDIENVTTMRFGFVTLFHPGDAQSIYFLDRESDRVWRFYSLVRTGRNASWLVTENDASAINRAVPFYRHLAGIPTDQEPPPAR